MKVRELRELLSSFDQDAEVRANAVFDYEDAVNFDGVNVFDIFDINTSEQDEVILEIG